MSRPSPSSRLTYVGIAVVAVAVVALAVAVYAVVEAERSGRTEPVAATCTGHASDSARIQAAIDRSEPGGEVVFTGSRCLITTTISLAGERSYRGESRSTRLVAAPHSNLPAVLASDSWVDDETHTGAPIQLRDLTIDANAADNPRSGDGLILRSWQTTVEDVTIEGSRRDGLRLTNLSRHGRHLRSTQVNGTLRNLFVTDSGANGIDVQDTQNAVTDWTLTDNWIANSGQDAIRSDNGAGWTIERNHVYDVGASAIEVSRLYATSVSDNYVEDFVTAGVLVSVNGGAPSTIAHNRIVQQGRGSGPLLSIERANYGHAYVVCEANTLQGNGSGTAMVFERGTHALTVTSFGNQVSGVAVARQVAPGVQVDAGS